MLCVGAAVESRRRGWVGEVSDDDDDDEGEGEGIQKLTYPNPPAQPHLI